MKSFSHNYNSFKIVTLISFLMLITLGNDSIAQKGTIKKTLNRQTLPTDTFRFKYVYKNITEYQVFDRYKPNNDKGFLVKGTFKAGEGLKDGKPFNRKKYTGIYSNVTIKSGSTLHIPVGQTLLIQGNVYLKTEGTLKNEGRLVIIEGNLFIGNYSENSILGHQDHTNFINTGDLYVQGNLIGQHPHGCTFKGNIAIEENVAFHFHKHKSPSEANFYFNEVKDKFEKVKIHDPQKHVMSAQLSKGKKHAGLGQNIPLQKLKPYLGLDLPVELSSFSCTQEESFTAIKWTTAQEINNSHFTIEKSYDKKNFEKIDEVEGQGNSNTVKQYKIDVPTDKNRTVYYRLTQFDFDGKSESWIQAVMSDEDTKVDVSVYPNPTTDFLKVETNSIDDTPMDYYLINTSTGVKTKLTSSSSQYSSQKFDVSGLSQGVYVLEVLQGNKRIYQKKIIKN
ncbi:T9SS type A sorting domain-containing protein [Flammeovirga kamogawensis]|uniref:T9SS type A sorting domain-containing protein n=1 Tax=Flammeovirga kamogawensis TaxID=373891 RepID=A0ABX8GYV1_9BACT|nr:T9SS type A sorting domain-containing protein [Flammeovirga kamogawensis]MBB6459160.1 hypothetical protein [Flammeovirga kamogawensis]QWG08726.1 T9SS type A sorting domain-containing protein [Flammeovirga kamogawensis]TRX67019.1 T9SS type A sorting domain-containing protein [Flammeovirga kamogawensis]